MPKKITMTAKPQATIADDWVAGTTNISAISGENSQPEVTSGPSSQIQSAALKRLTIDIPEELHARIKSQCAMRRTKMADEIRKLLEDKFAENA